MYNEPKIAKTASREEIESLKDARDIKQQTEIVKIITLVDAVRIFEQSRQHNNGVNGSVILPQFLDGIVEDGKGCYRVGNVQVRNIGKGIYAVANEITVRVDGATYHIAGKKFDQIGREI